jgi:hypothetical protein
MDRLNRQLSAAIDPLRHPPVMPAVRDPCPEDLRPFLNGWSPYGPDTH